MINATTRPRAVLSPWRWLLAVATLAASPGVVAEGCPAAGFPGDIATIALIEKKPALDRADFRDYWRDIHGVLAVRIPGFWTYTQYHLGDEIPGLSANPKAATPIHGLAEVTYCSEQAMAGLASSAVTDLIKADEQNAFAGTYLHGTVRGDSVTLVAESPARAPLDTDTEGTLIVLVARPAGESAASFGARFEAAMAALPAACPTLLWARRHLFQPYQADAWQAPNVNHDPLVIHDAALELRGSRRAQALGCVVDAVIPALTARPGTSVNVYPVAGRYQMVRDGRPTLLGLRGLPAYRLIERLGADNQASPAVLRTLYGTGHE